MPSVHVGRLLQERRLDLKAALDEASKWCRMSTADLERLEAQPDVSVREFEQVCRGLAVDPAALLAGRAKTPTRIAARFRAAMPNPSHVKPSILRLLAAASEIGRGLGSLMTLLGREIPLQRYFQVKAVSRDHLPWEEGYLLGESARKAIYPAVGPIPDVEQLLSHQLGIHVAIVRFADDTIDAASLWERGTVPVILLNRDSGRVTYILSRSAILTHELCHLMHDAGDGDIVTRVSCQDGQGNYDEAVEQRARGFAPAFLAPRPQVQNWRLGCSPKASPRDLVVALASHWGLSLEGAIWHAKNSQLITPAIAQSLAQENIPAKLPAGDFDPQDIRFPPAMVHPDLPQEASPLMDGWATALIVDALEAGAISVGRAKELLAF